MGEGEDGEEMIGEEKKETVVGMYCIREQSIVNIKGTHINPSQIVPKYNENEKGYYHPIFLMIIDEKQVNNTVKESTHLILKCENSDFLLRSTKHHILAGIIIEGILDQPVRQQQ